MDWKEFEQNIRDLAERIDFKPDVIVGITRGGLVPARFLSSLLHTKKVHCLSVVKDGATRRVITKIEEPLGGSTVLLVEDVLESGTSLAVAKEYLESLGAIVRTCCLFTLPSAQIRPDFQLALVEIVPKFPWDD